MNKILILSMAILFSILACSISTTVPATYTASPSEIPKATSTVETSTLTPTVVNPTFQCRVVAQDLNVRSCESKSCSNIGNYSVYNDILTVDKVSGDNGWYHIKEFGGGWVSESYCVRKN